MLRGVRHHQVAGQQVEQRRDVGGALDARVPAQRHDPAAGAAHVAQQRLQDRRRPDVLGAHAVLGPADRVDERRRPVAAAVGGDPLGHLRERLRLDAADLGDHLRRVAGEVPLEHLEDAARVLQRLVALAASPGRRGRRCRPPGTGRRCPRRRRAGRPACPSAPRGPACRPARRAPAGRRRPPRRRPGTPSCSRRSGRFSGSKPEKRPSRSSVSWKSSRSDRRRVRVGDDVLLEVLLVVEDVLDQAAEEGDVAARAQRHVQVGDGAGAGEPRVDVDDLRAPRLGLHHPLEADRVALGHVRALDDDAVSVGEVLLEVRGTATTERGTQTGHRGGVLYAGLVLDLDRRPWPCRASS